MRGVVANNAGVGVQAAGLDQQLAERLDLDDAGGVCISGQVVRFSASDLRARAEKWWARRPAYVARNLAACAGELGHRAAGVARLGMEGRMRGAVRISGEEALSVLAASGVRDGSMVLCDLQGNWWKVSVGGERFDACVVDGKAPVALWEAASRSLLLGAGMEEAEGSCRAVYCPRIWSEASLLAARVLSGMVAQSVCSMPGNWDEGVEVPWNGSWGLLEGFLQGRWGFPVLRCWRGEWCYFGSVGGDDALLSGGGAEALAEIGAAMAQPVNSVVLAEAGRMLVADLAASEGHPESAMEWRGMSASPDEEHVSSLVAWAEGSAADVVKRALWVTLWLCGVDRGPGMRLGARILAAALERRRT